VLKAEEFISFVMLFLSVVFSCYLKEDEQRLGKKMHYKLK